MTTNWDAVTASLTHGKKSPHDWGRGEAPKHIICAAEVCEVRHHYALAPALTPHVHLTTLGLGSRCMCGVTSSDLYDSVKTKRRRSESGAAATGVTLKDSPLFLRHDLNRAQLVALVTSAQLSVSVGTPGIKQALVCQCQRVGVAWDDLGQENQEKNF